MIPIAIDRQPTDDNGFDGWLVFTIGGNLGYKNEKSPE